MHVHRHDDRHHRGANKMAEVATFPSWEGLRCRYSQRKEYPMYELQVEKMTCGGCASRVKRAVLSLDEAANVDIDLRAKRVKVKADAGLDELKAAITGAGYPVADARAL